MNKSFPTNQVGRGKQPQLQMNLVQSINIAVSSNGNILVSIAGSAYDAEPSGHRIRYRHCQCPSYARFLRSLFSLRSLSIASSWIVFFVFSVMMITKIV